MLLVLVKHLKKSKIFYKQKQKEVEDILYI